MDNGKPLRISWSRIRQYQECKAKAGLLAAGMKSPVTDIRAFFPGTVADRCAGDWLSLDNPEPGWMAGHVDTILDREEAAARESGDGVVRWRGPQDREKVRDWCRECVTRLEPLLYRYIIPYLYEPHARFRVPMTIPGTGGEPRQILLTGETDFRTWREEKVPLSIDDLKATQDPGYWRKVTGQLVFYEIATWGMTGRWPEVSRLFQPMCPEPVLEFRFSADHRREMFVTICAVANDFWRDNLPPKADSIGCDRCEVRAPCPKYAYGRGRVPLSA